MPDMKLIGKGMHQSKGNNNLIITLESETRIGQPISDKNGKVIGKIFDVFGSIEAPYASIKLFDGVDIGKPEGKPVFLSDKPDKRDKRRERKRRKSR
ncbi:MAG: Gar1/Naf1 family protein [Candidatus Bathyarchaeota archaeon]|nr:Gar1/Naf1 family protein [Candidatus Bathyarchaeota archaeon]